MPKEGLSEAVVWGRFGQVLCYIGGTTRPVIALKLFPPEAGQAGEGEPWGLRTGAKALFCLAADGKEEKGKRDDEELELPGIVGLEGIM